MVRAGHFLQEQLRIGDLEVVGAEGARADDAEVLVAQHDGVAGAPLVAGEQARVDEVDVDLEGRLEAVLPRLQLRQDGDVLGDQRVLARAERVAELAQVDELRHLRFANDQLRAVLDRLVIVREPERDRVARVVGPLDDLEQLSLDEVENPHRSVASVAHSLYALWVGRVRRQRPSALSNPGDRRPVYPPDDVGSRARSAGAVAAASGSVLDVDASRDGVHIPASRHLADAQLTLPACSGDTNEIRSAVTCGSSECAAPRIAASCCWHWSPWHRVSVTARSGGWGGC